MSKSVGNRTCQAVGHDWAPTTVTTYRRCIREHCGTVERLVHGQWVPVPRAQPYKRPTWTQPTLFTTGQWLSTREEEHRAERAYRRILGL